jgi:hypothetical protein
MTHEVIACSLTDLRAGEVEVVTEAWCGRRNPCVPVLVVLEQR